MPRARKRVLFFEDDFASMFPVKAYLEQMRGWHVELSAASGLLDRLKREPFDLILLDLMIRPASLDADGQVVENVHFEGVPWERTGIEFLKRLRRGEFAGQPGQGTPADVPVIVVSAIANSSVESEFQDDVAFLEYDEKPFVLEELVERIDRLVQGRNHVS